MGIKELRTQTSMRRKLQHWRSMRWLSRADINLDDSLSQGLLAGGGAIFWGIFALVNVERVGFCRLLDRHLNPDRPSDEPPER